MEKLLSGKWDSVLLNDLKQEALMNGRYDNEALRDKAVYLYDNPKMSVFKSDYIVLDSTFPQIVLMSKNLFAKSLESDDFNNRDELVARATTVITSIGSQPDIIKTPVEDFVSWAEKSGFTEVVQNLNLRKKSTLKI